MYRVIISSEFDKYCVRKVHTADKLILAYCQGDNEGWWCVNVMYRSSNMKDLIKFVRLAKEKNAEHQKIISEKEN